MNGRTYDLAILGGGAAAFAAAIKASDLGARAVMISGGTLGGTCVNVGCVPSKFLLVAGEHLFYTGRDGFRGLGFPGKKLDLPSLMAQKEELVLGFRKEKYSDVVAGLPAVDLVEGRAEFVGTGRASVNGQVVEAEKFLVATGSSPQVLPIPGLEKAEYLISDQALSLKEAPKSLLVIGGRAVGLELAQIFSHFGSAVTVLQRSPRIIPEEEPEVADGLRAHLEEEGMRIVTGVGVLRVEPDREGVAVIAEVGGREQRFTAERLLLATGRKPNTDGMGLAEIGVNLRGNGAVIVDEELRTSAPEVWAAGDVSGEPMLETVAAKEGSIAAENALNGSRRRIDFSAVPHAVFTSPQVAAVGLTDKQANEQGFRCRCRTLPMSMVPKALIIQDTRGLIKMVTEADSGRILGVHILSPLAAELIHEATVLVKHRLTVDDVIDTVHIFPALSESIKLVAQSFRRDIGKMSCCVE